MGVVESEMWLLISWHRLSRSGGVPQRCPGAVSCGTWRYGPWRGGMGSEWAWGSWRSSPTFVIPWLHYSVHHAPKCSVLFLIHCLFLQALDGNVYDHLKDYLMAFSRTELETCQAVQNTFQFLLETSSRVSLSWMILCNRILQAYMGSQTCFQNNDKTEALLFLVAPEWY